MAEEIIMLHPVLHPANPVVPTYPALKDQIRLLVLSPFGSGFRFRLASTYCSFSKHSLRAASISSASTDAKISDWSCKAQ